MLGSLVEKQLTTPQQYPLTLNALALACSQSTNRDPVMTLDELTTQRALEELKEHHLVRFVLPSHGKSVTRYRQVLDEAYGLDTARVALMAVLLLRGPQTLGELRRPFGAHVGVRRAGCGAIQLKVLAGQPEPLVRLLARQPGQKEERWQQLLATEPGGSEEGGSEEGGSELVAEPEPVDTAPLSLQSEAARSDTPTESAATLDGRAGLEQRVEALASEIAALRDEIGRLSSSLSDLRHSLGED